MRPKSGVQFLPVGDTLYNGMDLGGARIYPLSAGLAIQPPAEYSNYIGSAQGLPVTPPVSALSGTAGVQSSHPGVASIMANPLGRQSPLPWVVGGLFLAVAATHLIHYADRKR